MIRPLAWMLALVPACVFAQSAPDLRAVATYESAGLYWSAPGGAADCRVRFRRAGENTWRSGLELWFDARNNECRGSLVHLAPGQRYEAEVGASGGTFARKVEFTTWPERTPVARTVKVPAGSKRLEIREGGTPTGYVVYDGGGAMLDAAGEHDNNILIGASHVVVRNFVLKGAKADAVLIGPNVTDVVIEDNDISGWGRPQVEGKPGAMDLDAGIRAICHSCPEVERVTIQRNRIHSPRHGANSWSDGHPHGPQAITFSYCGGNHVIRHNRIHGGEGTKFNDAIGGEDNFTNQGFPNADSDIYGNHIADAWDDGIEAEGANRNVRIWDNYIDNTAIGIATTATAIGPVYIFRNVYDRSRFHEKRSPDNDQRGPFLKAGSSRELGDGRRYVFHNTMRQAVDPNWKSPMGAGTAIGGTGADQLVNNTWSMNNLYRTWRDGSAMDQLGRGNVFDNDLRLGPGKVDLAKVRDRGRRIPNFNDTFTGAAPDIGAEELDMPRVASGEKRPGS